MSQKIDVDPLEQCYTRQVRLEKWSNGELAASEEYTLRGDIYFKNELLLMLAETRHLQVKEVIQRLLKKTASSPAEGIIQLLA